MSPDSNQNAQMPNPQSGDMGQIDHDGLNEPLIVKESSQFRQELRNLLNDLRAIFERALRLIS